MMECSICYESIQSLNIFKTKCNHYFCKYCIDSWIKKNRTCPLCRSDLFKTEEEFMLENIEQYFRNLVETKIFILNPETIYSKFFYYFNSFINIQKEESIENIFNFYSTRYKKYINQLYFVPESFLENDKHPFTIFKIFIDLIQVVKEPTILYTCFSECIFFYNLKIGYTQNQLEQFDFYKNNLHLTLTSTR